MKFIRRVIIFLILILLIAASIIGYKGYNKYKSALDGMPLKEKIEAIKTEENYTNLDDLPKMYKDAVVSVEDHRFYNHGAIDIISILRAIYVDVTNASLIEGGSTITQQLAKNIYFTRGKNSKQKSSRNIDGF